MVLACGEPHAPSQRRFVLRCGSFSKDLLPKAFQRPAHVGERHGFGRIGPPTGMMNPSPRIGGTLNPRAFNDSSVNTSRVGSSLGNTSMPASSNLWRKDFAGLFSS